MNPSWLNPMSIANPCGDLDLQPSLLIEVV